MSRVESTPGRYVAYQGGCVFPGSKLLGEFGWVGIYLGDEVAE